MTARLISLDYQVPGCDTSLNGLPVVIGSSPEAGIRLTDHSVSLRHCRIDQIDGQLVVRDLGSVHGTFVNGSRITQSPLLPGDSLGIGLLTFFLKITQDPTPMEDRRISTPRRRSKIALLVEVGG